MLFEQSIRKLKSRFKLWKAELLVNWGCRLIREGALLKVGQAVNLPRGEGPSLTGRGTVIRRKAQVVYVKNIFFNFRENKMTYEWSERPIMTAIKTPAKKDEQAQ